MSQQVADIQTELKNPPRRGAEPTRGAGGLSAGRVGLILVILIAVPCFATLPWSLQHYNLQDSPAAYGVPSWSQPLGTDALGRSLMWRCLLGGAISLGIGLSAATMAVGIGVTWGALAGYAGGRTDALMMRFVDVLYGLPYILLVVLLNIALKPTVRSLAGSLLPTAVAAQAADVVTLLVAIGAVSWLTMARVIRGQVLSLRSQPFIEAAKATGVGPARMLRVHLLPNLVGPIVVYTTLTVPAAILEESFLSFLGIGVQPPLPSWGKLASDGLGGLWALAQGRVSHWWLLVFPCVLLGLTLMALNFMGDALRERFDPKGKEVVRGS